VTVVRVAHGVALLAAAWWGALAGGCDAAAKTRSESARVAEVDPRAPRLPALQSARLDYLFAAMSGVSRNWPWSTADDVCVLLLGIEAQWGLNCSEPPSVQFARTADLFRGKPVFARSGSRYRIGGRELSTAELLKTMSAAAHVDEAGARRSDLPSGHPWLLLGSLEGLRANHPAFEDCSTEEWISVALHELAHARQLSMPGFDDQLRSINSGAFDPSRLAKLFSSDAEYRRLVDAEYAQLVAAAWSDPDPTQARAALSAWLERYATRRALLEKQPNAAALVATDSLFTYIEGAARYVESQYLVDAAQHPASAPAKDPLFRSYVGFAGRGYAGMPNKQMDAEYFYAIGFHVCVLLERIDPTWKSRVHADSDGVIGQVRATIARRD
jgi:hypothetical protein